MMLVNKAALRSHLLELAEGRAHKFTRVGADVYDEAHRILVLWAHKLVVSQPSKGKTICVHGVRKGGSTNE